MVCDGMRQKVCLEWQDQARPHRVLFAALPQIREPLWDAAAYLSNLLGFLHSVSTDHPSRLCVLLTRLVGVAISTVLCLCPSLRIWSHAISRIVQQDRDFPSAVPDVHVLLPADQGGVRPRFRALDLRPIVSVAFPLICNVSLHDEKRKFIFIIVWAISMTACFVHRYTFRSPWPRICQSLPSQ